jgi:hypothetical protein
MNSSTSAAYKVLWADRALRVHERSVRCAEKSKEGVMVDKSGLKVVGWLFGSTTAFVLAVAAFLVSDAIASNASSLPTFSASTAIASTN